MLPKTFSNYKITSDIYKNVSGCMFVPLIQCIHCLQIEILPEVSTKRNYLIIPFDLLMNLKSLKPTNL